MADLAEGRAGATSTSEELPSFLPPFANQANKDLDSHVRRLEQELDTTQQAIDASDERISIMSGHLAQVHQELKYTQTRLDARTNEIRSESHLKQLSQREAGRLGKEVARLKAEQQVLGDKLGALHSDIYRGNEKLDQFKLVMNWNQEEFEQWALASRQKEEDNLALEKYQRQDEAKVKELSLVLERASREVQKRKKQLAEEVTETQAAQIELDTTAHDFRVLHKERQELVGQWEEAIQAMQRRDEAIQLASEKFAAKKAELVEAQANLDAQARFLENEEANNREVDARIDLFEREVGKLRDVHGSEQKRLADIMDEVDRLKNMLAKAADELVGQRTANGRAREMIETKRHALDALQQKQASAKQQLQGEFGNLSSLEQRVKELEDMRQREQDRLVAVEKELKGLKTEQFKRGQELFSLRSKEKEMISEIAGGQAQNKNLAEKINGLDDQVVKQHEMLYNVEFQLQMMERKVARAGGERSDEETRALNLRIAKLTQVLEGVNAEHAMLVAQVKKAEEDLGVARRHNQEHSKEKAKIEESTTQLKLETEMTGRCVKAVIKEKEEKMVEVDVAALEVRRLRLALSAKADEVFSLENRKFQLRISMEERKHEIQVHKEALLAELKMLRDDLHRVTLELTERAQRVDRLQCKFNVIHSRHADADGEEKSQAYYVIKAAQEREELQRQGDELDAKIRKAEKEVQGLEAALAKLNGTNLDLSASFRRVDDEQAYAERSALRDQLDKAYDALKFKRTEERQVVEDVAQARARLDNLAAEEAQLHSMVDDLGQRKAEAERQVEEQQQKQTRAARRADKLRRDLRQRLAPDYPAGDVYEDKDVRLAEVQDVNRAVMQDLAVLASENPSAGIGERLEALGLKLPTASSPGSVRSVSRSNSSAGGSVKSFASIRSSRSTSSKAAPMQTIQFN
ncbi:hypothetical protein WJX72_009778 [[Myrmecia] bisecta]|uniref:Coiled-coil domain-containing protein 39 n=1 Tax=[Myrmecia] bisecta TaxID=41462 RepID=A0AAW1QGI7_9CHLO